MAGQRFGVKDARDQRSYLIPDQSWRWRVAEKSSEIHLSGYLLCLRLLPLRSRTRGVRMLEWTGREREAVPPRLPSGWAVGLDLDRLR
jgi:hypothetical protein